MPSSASAIPQIARRYPRSSGVLGLSSKDTDKSTSSAGCEPPFTVTDGSGTETSDLCVSSGGSGPSSSGTVISQLIDSEARTHNITLAPRGSLPGGYTAAESHVDRRVRHLLSGYGKQCSWTEADGDWDSMSGDLLFLPNSKWKTGPERGEISDLGTFKEQYLYAALLYGRLLNNGSEMAWGQESILLEPTSLCVHLRNPWHRKVNLWPGLGFASYAASETCLTVLQE